MTDHKRYRVGIDVGGTFTDFVMAETPGNRLIFHKEPSVPDDPSRAIATGIAALLQQEAAHPSQIEVITHGTTLGLNAIIQERGCRVALVTSAGNRDVMELARGRLPSSYNFRLGREKALIGRRDVYEVSARMLADGTIHCDADDTELDRLAHRLSAGGYDAVAVMLINSYVDATLETRIADGLARRLGGIPVTASARVWPEVKEYERALIAVLNAYLHPLMSAYFDRLAGYLDGLGVRAALYITSNNGGTMSLPAARERPVDTILSGPASGVSAAARLAQGLCDDRRTHVLTFDMGGTSSDVSSIVDGAPEIAQTSKVGDYPLMLPVVSVWAVGAGGGSVAWRDAQGVLKVGPHSAGANPGPVAYGRGGQDATITDALLAMGVLNADTFLQGRMALDRPAAEAALVRLGDGLGLDGAAAVGRAVCRVAVVRMATELTKILARKGLDTRDAVLMAFGGAGPTVAALLADEAGIGRVMVPASPGTFCALGALMADVRRDFVQPCRMTLRAPGDGAGRFAAIIADLEARARDWIDSQGSLVQSRDFAVAADMRYPGQSFEFQIGLLDMADVDALVAAFHAEHERVYGFRQAGGGVEIVNLRMTVTGRLAPVSLPVSLPGNLVTAPAPQTRVERDVLLQDWTSTRVMDRGDLAAGTRLDGPLIVEQPDTTTLVPPGWTLDVDTVGTLWLRRMTS